MYNKSETDNNKKTEIWNIWNNQYTKCLKVTICQKSITTKYPTNTEWLNGFLWQTIDKCHYGLKVGGILALNVANTRRIKNFEDETLRLGKEINFNHIDTWQLQLSSQTGTPKYEPIFIFQK